MGLSARKSRNEQLRKNGEEPLPGLHAGVKRRARYLKRTKVRPIKIKHPERYLNAAARQRSLAKAA